ncbi:glycosyltransferase family 39 protein [Streptomyces sp. NPDC014891]|uniref:glycosyltransferase family 39 protein n=1 Tax=Streptomyces sp. NPDC014891 TaxID=3364929 RepID=UPI0036FDD724
MFWFALKVAGILAGKVWVKRSSDDMLIIRSPAALLQRAVPTVPGRRAREELRTPHCPASRSEILYLMPSVCESSSIPPISRGGAVLDPSATNPRRSYGVSWLIPLLGALALGLWGLSRQGSVWRDEAATWQVATRSTPEIWHLLQNIDVVHGAYYLLMHALFECFGAGTTTLRLPSVIATGIAAACVGRIGERLAGTWVGIAGGVAFVLLPAVQFHMQEGRPYAFVAAGAAIATLLLVMALQQRGRAVYWAAYGVAVTVSGLLNWLSLMMLSAHMATLLWVRAGRGVWKPWTVVSSAVVICVLPLILFSRGQSGQVSWIPPLTWHMLIGPAILFLIGGTGALLDPSRGVGRLSAAAVGLPLLMIPQLGLIGLSLIQPLYLERYVLFSELGLALLIGSLIGSALQAVRSRRPGLADLVVPVVVVFATVGLLPQLLAKRSPASRVDDVRAVAADVQRLKEAGNVVLFIPSARRDTKSVTPDDFSGLRDIALAQSPEASGTLKGVEADPGRIRTAMLAEQRILLVTDVPGIPVNTERDKTKMSVLKQYFAIVAVKRTHGRQVRVYERLGPSRQ